MLWTTYSGFWNWNFAWYLRLLLISISFPESFTQVQETPGFEPEGLTSKQNQIKFSASLRVLVRNLEIIWNLLQILWKFYSVEATGVTHIQIIAMGAIQYPHSPGWSVLHLSEELEAIYIFQTVIQVSVPLTLLQWCIDSFCSVS